MKKSYFKNIFLLSVLLNAILIMFSFVLETGHSCSGLETCDICLFIAALNVLAIVLSFVAFTSFTGYHIVLSIDHLKAKKADIILSEIINDFKKEETTTFESHKSLFQLKQKLLVDMEVIY